MHNESAALNVMPVYLISVHAHLYARLRKEKTPIHRKKNCRRT